MDLRAESGEYLLSDTEEKKSNWQSKLGRTGYKGRKRIMMGDVRKMRRKKILMKSTVSNMSAVERSK